MSGEIKRLTYNPRGPIPSGPAAITEFKNSSVLIRPTRSYIPVPNLHDPEPSDIYIAVEKLKKLLPEVLNKWQSVQKILFDKILPQDWENTINQFYLQIWNDLPIQLKNKLSLLSEYQFNNVNFNSLDFKNRLYLLNGLSASYQGAKKYEEFLRASIGKIDQEILNQIKHIALALYGNKNLNDFLPSPIIKAIEASLQKHLVKPLTTLQVPGLEFSIKSLGSGYVGMAFLVEIDKSKFVLKLPIAPPDRVNFRHFQYEQNNLKQYEEILKKYANQNPPEQDFIPRLIYDARGEPLSKEDEVTVTKYYRGNKLNMTKGGTRCHEEYIRSGLDDDFLLDFIDFYLRFAREGADLSDITLGNYFHNGVSLAFYELAGLDPDISSRYKELKKLKEESPIAACVFTLLTAISTLEQPKVSERYGEFLREQVRAKKSFGAEDFFVHRIGQLVKVFNQAIDKKILNRQELQEGIEYLYKVCSSPNVNPNLKISQRGLEYLGWLKEWIKKSNLLF